MKYFDTLPKILVTDKTGVSTLYTNIMARASIIKEKLNDPVLYYNYDIQDQDTPEIVAEKYYGDSYRYWLVLFTNEILDPQWGWPLNSTNFGKYIESKYSGNIDPYTDVYEYNKIVTKYDVRSQTTTVEKFVIDETEYNSLSETTTQYNIGLDTTIVTITKNIKTYFEYEMELNESKRSIRLLKKQYANSMEYEFENIMR